MDLLVQLIRKNSNIHYCSLRGFTKGFYFHLSSPAVSHSISSFFAHGVKLITRHRIDFVQIDQALRQAKPCKGADPQAGGLAAARVLLVHSGGDSQRSPTQCVCGKAWSALNSCSRDKENMCNTPMDLLLDHLSRLFGSGLAAGTLVVTACDVMLLVPPEVAATADWSFDESGGVAGLAIAADAEKYAPNHGVYCLDGGAYGEGKKNAIARVGRWVVPVARRASKVLRRKCLGHHAIRTLIPDLNFNSCM